MKTCTIQNNTISLNHSVIFTEKGIPLAEFAKKALKALRVEYAKFYKMDTLSKMAFLAAEVLLSPFSQNGIALVFANRAASLDTDLKHQATIADEGEYYPSPAVFVYTLPNICLGEISIRHQLKTENAFMVFDNYAQAEVFFKEYSRQLIAEKSAEKVLCAWVEVLEDECEVIATLY